MDFIIECPRCHQKMQVKEEWVGNEITCPACQENMRVPSPAENNAPPPPRHSGKQNSYASAETESNSHSADPMALFGKICCMATALLAVIAMIIAFYLGFRVRAGLHDRKIIDAEYSVKITALQEEQEAAREKFFREEKELYSQRRFSERNKLRENYDKKQVEIRKKISACEKEYEKRLEAHNKEYGEILAEADHDWGNTILSAVFAFVLMLVFCVINLKLFPVCSNMLAQTQTVVSSLKIIHIMQLLFVGAAVVFFYMAYSEEVIAWSGLGCWMLCIAATLLNKKRFGIQETEDASPVQDLTAWLTLPLKVSLSLLAVIFSFGILFLIYTICRIEYSVEPFFRFGIIVSALPLGIYLNYLLSVYSLEIGLAIISVPRLLRNNKSK